MKATTIEMSIEQGIRKTNVQVDNSSECKDMVINQKFTHSKEEEKEKEIQIQVDEDGGLKVNGVLIEGVVLDMFIQFVNQAKINNN
ncbi:MAG: hypothetical protein V4547_16260 [Bacteroidota bacterium]